MNIELLTRQDFMSLKVELLNEIKQIIQPQHEQKEWQKILHQAHEWSVEGFQVRNNIHDGG